MNNVEIKRVIAIGPKHIGKGPASRIRGFKQAHKFNEQVRKDRTGRIGFKP